MVKSWTEGCHAVRSRLAIVLVLLFALQSWSAVVLPGDVKSHHSEGDENTFRDVAVLEPFSFDTYTDYSDVAVIINNQSEDSRIIGTAFALARNIPPERVILLTNESTPTGETINANQFTEFFAEPISEIIEERNLTGLNVLVTTKGVPFESTEEQIFEPHLIRSWPSSMERMPLLFSEIGTLNRIMDWLLAMK